MQFKRSEVVRVLEALGWGNAGSWTKERLMSKVKQLPSMVSEDDPTGDEECDRLLTEMISAVKDDDDVITIEDDMKKDKDEKPAKSEKAETSREAAEKKPTKAAKSVDSATKPVRVPKKPAKAAEKKPAKSERTSPVRVPKKSTRASKQSKSDVLHSVTSEGVSDDLEIVDVPCLTIGQHDSQFLITAIPARVLCSVAYVSVRGVSDDANAVQRVLSNRRIASIKDYTLRGGQYPTSFVLNWVNSDSLENRDGRLHIKILEKSAQILDGQHRLAGIAEAIKEDAAAGDMLIPVAIYSGLDAEECANIFLAINTEQKPVQKSFVYDLYGVASDYVVDQNVKAARELAMGLFNDRKSAYFGKLKSVNSNTRGGIALASAVFAFKPFVGNKGVFQMVGVSRSSLQMKLVLSYFSAIRTWCGSSWSDSSNVFFTAAGFIGAIEFLRYKLLGYCAANRIDSEKQLVELMDRSVSPITLDQLKGLGGAAARSAVMESLDAVFDLQID